MIAPTIVAAANKMPFDNDFREIGKRAEGRFKGAYVFQLQLLGDVLNPGLAENFPTQHVDAARAEQRPHRHFNRAGVGGGDKRELVILRHTEDGFRFVDDFHDALDADARAVRAPDQRAFQCIERPAGALGAGAGGKAGVVRLCGRTGDGGHGMAFLY